MAAPTAAHAAPPSPRHLLAAAREVQHLIEDDRALWPGLSDVHVDVDGHVAVHYAAVATSATAEVFSAPDGVISGWRRLLVDAHEAGQPSEVGEARTVTGSRDGYPVVVRLTITPLSTATATRDDLRVVLGGEHR